MFKCMNDAINNKLYGETEEDRGSEEIKGRGWGGVGGDGERVTERREEDREGEKWEIEQKRGNEEGRDPFILTLLISKDLCKVKPCNRHCFVGFDRR